MSKRSRLTTGLSGVAGEYFVAAELSRQGYIASLTLKNTRGIDILASNAEATKSIAIQVKTKQGRGNSWMLNKKEIGKDTATNLCFVFVRLNGLDAPDYYIVPRAEVVEYASQYHRDYMSTPGRKDTSMRVFSPENEYPKNRWESLGLD